MAGSKDAQFQYANYLASKESIDERSLNPHVWSIFLKTFTAFPSGEVKILEIGGGIGATLKRLVRANPSRDISYTLLDLESGNLAYFESHVTQWMLGLDYKQHPDGGFKWINGDGRQINVTVVQADILEYVEEERNEAGWDILVAQAFLDLFDLESLLPKLLLMIRRGGVFYFPINFDGITSFLPGIEPSVDSLVENIYHNSMDAKAKMPARRGRSQSGRYLLSLLTHLDADIISAGSSDWIVHARNGRYSGQDRYFLEQILHFVEGELHKSNDIDSKVALDWLAQRRRQLELGKLIYLAHQIDIVGRRLK